MCAARIRIGIGSWSDPEYTGVLFPKGVKPAERLKIYAEWFDHVEINASYYRTPTRSQVEGWVAQTPADFTFDVKLHRAFSDTPEASVRGGSLVPKLLEGVRPLLDAKKLGAFFLVLPPGFSPGKSRLEELDLLVEKLQPQTLAVEVRNNGWVDASQREHTLEFFRAHKLAWIAVDMPQVKGSTIMPAIDEVTNSRLAYLRLHGRNKDWPKLKTAEERHSYEYGEEELAELAKRVRALAMKAEEVHVIANNHAQDFAPKTALALQRLLGVTRASRS
jgi:uncharacterized protein YecE (DUF72 family)